MIENGLCGGDIMSGKSSEEKSIILEKRKLTNSKKSSEELEEIRSKNSTGTKKFIKENPEIRKESCAKIVKTRKDNGQPWHTEETKIKIGQNSKSGTQEVRNKLSKALIGKKNPEHSIFMSSKVGLDRPNTKLFLIITPNGDKLQFVGFKSLREYCKLHTMSYKYLCKNINLGIINPAKYKLHLQSINCIGYEIKEIIR
jgi:hypothetical protein